MRQNFPPAFGFHILGSRLDQPPRVGHSLLRRVVTVEGQISAEQRARLGPGGGADVVRHLVHRDVRGVRIAEHDHAERIAHEQQRHAAFVEQARHRIIISGERGDFLATLERADLVGGNFQFRFSHGQ